jgi:ABC-2 type transport system ATP-binding protein
MQPVLVIEDLRKSYRTAWRKPRRPALNGLNLKVPGESITGLLGPNGAGKTTTLKAIMGLIYPESGRVEVFGTDGINIEARRRIGFLPEQPYFDLYSTPRRLLMYYGRLSGLATHEIETRISHLLSLVGLEKEGDLPLESFSRGMLQRMGFAQALVSNPDFLVLDEPSSGLDPLGKIQVRDLLEGLRREGTTVLLSSHQLSEIEEICDQVAIINEGRNVASGSLNDLLGSGEEYEITLDSSLAGEVAGLPDSAEWLGEDGMSLIMHKKDINQALKTLIKEGATIASVRKRRMSLEEFFVSKVGEKERSVGD